MKSSLKIGTRIIIPLLVFAWIAAAQNVITPEMVVDLKSVTSVAISPNGEHVAYVKLTPRSPEEETGSSHRELFVISMASKAGQQYTRKPHKVESVQWAPDNQWLYFDGIRAEYAEHEAVYRIALDGGEPVLVAEAATKIKDFQVSPDGKWLAYTRKDEKTSEEEKDAKLGHDVRTVDQDYKFTRLYVQEISGDNAKNVSGQLAVWDFEWSPDASQLLFQASKRPKTDDSYMFKKLYTVSRDGGEPKQLTETTGKLEQMRWSPNGKWIAFNGGIDNSDPTGGSLFVVEAAGGDAVNLTEGYQGTVEWLEWLDNRSIAFTATERSHRVMKTIPAKGGAMKTVIDGGFEIEAFSLAKNGDTFALRASTQRHPREVYSGSVKSGKLNRLTNSNPELEKVRLSGISEISWTARDGLEITGLLMLPLDYQKGKRYPCIVQVHGGPESATVDGWNTTYVRWGELLAAQGYAVFSPNYRGSTGRGVAYAKADHKDLGGQEFLDVIDGLKHLAEKEIIDLDRVGIGGFSYGGYFSALAATRYTEHFKAASMGAGIANWISFTGTSDIPYENSMVHWNLSVWENMDKVWEASPLAHVQKSQTALLVSHGEKDLRVPISQGWEIYTAMKMLGKTVEFDIYPREPHGFRERNHQLFSIQRNLAWFEKYVKGSEKVSEMIP